MFNGRLTGVSDYEMLLTAQHSTAQHSTAQHSDCAFFSTVHIHKRKRIKASINMYMDKMYVFIGAFFCLIKVVI